MLMQTFYSKHTTITDKHLRKKKKKNQKAINKFKHKLKVKVTGSMKIPICPLSRKFKLPILLDVTGLTALEAGQGNFKW